MKKKKVKKGLDEYKYKRFAFSNRKIVRTEKN